MSKKIKPEDFVETYKIEKEKEVPQSECDTFSTWIPLEYLQKYDVIQKRSKRKFGKFLKKVIMKTIDAVDVEEKAA